MIINNYLVRGPVIACLILVFLCNVGAAQESIGERDKCRLASQNRVRFNMVFERKNTLPPYVVQAYVVVKPVHYNVHDLKQLVLSLNAKYCSENLVSGTIFDEKRAAQNTNMADYSLGKISEPAVRGFYWLDREKETSGIRFFKERGKLSDVEHIEIPVPKKP